MIFRAGSMAVEVLATAAVSIWAMIVLPLMARRDRDGGGDLAIALVYVIGLGPASLVLIDPAFERGVTTAGSSLHNTMSEAINLVVIVLALLALLSAGQRGGIRLPAWSLGLIGCGLAIPLSGLVNGGFNWRLLLFPLVVLALTQADVVAPAVLVKHLRRVLRVLTVGSLLWLVLGYGNAVLLFQQRTLFGIDQLAGLTRHPNNLGPLAALAFAVEVVAARGRRRTLFAACALITCLLAQSRAGWLAAAVVLLILLARRYGARLAVPGAFMVTCLAAVFAMQANAMGLKVDLNGRTAIWSVAWQTARQHPLLGAGPNALLQQSMVGHVSAVGVQAHNQLLDLMAKAGVVGFLALALFTVGGLRRAVTLSRERSALPLAAMLILLLDCIFEAPLELKLLPIACVVTLATRQRVVEPVPLSDPFPPNLGRELVTARSAVE